jgi:hypothetical protein
VIYSIFLVQWHFNLFSEKRVFVEGTADFAKLTECGVKMTLKENGKNVLNLSRLIGLYHPRQMFLKGVPLYDFIKKEKYIGKAASEDANAGAASSSTFDVNQHEEEGDKCPICLANFMDGQEIERLPCNVCLF